MIIFKRKLKIVVMSINGRENTTTKIINLGPSFSNGKIAQVFSGASPDFLVIIYGSNFGVKHIDCSDNLTLTNDLKDITLNLDGVATTTALTAETNARTTADTALQNHITTSSNMMGGRSAVKSNAITTPAIGLYVKIKGGFVGTGADFEYGTNHMYRICYTLALTTASTGKHIGMRVVFGNTTTGTASVIVSTVILEFTMDVQIIGFNSSTQISIRHVSKLTRHPSSGATPTVNVIGTAITLDLLIPNILSPSIELSSSSTNIGTYTMTRFFNTLIRVT